MEAGLWYPQDHLVGRCRFKLHLNVLCQDSAPQDQQPKLSRTGSRCVYEGTPVDFRILGSARCFGFLGLLLFGSGCKRTAGDFSSEGFRRMIEWMLLGVVSTKVFTWLIGYEAGLEQGSTSGSYGGKRKEVESIGEERQVEVDRGGGLVWRDLGRQ